MPRPERALDPAAGPVPEFAAALRTLRQQAGNPAYRELARRAGYSATTLADAASGRRLPGLAVVRRYVEACGADPAEWEARWRAVAETLAAAAAASDDSADSAPYLGLTSFQPEDADRFFGRERLVEEYGQRLTANGFLAIVGPSGTGKSSLLRAGLVPTLTRTPGPTSGALLLAPGARPSDDYAARLRAADHPPSLIAVDQFEEIFTLCRDEGQRAGFIEKLLRTVAAGTRVVIALRPDFYGHCARYERLASALAGGTVPLGPMNDEELRRAVTGPARLAGLTMERALVTKVLADVRGQAGALPLVSHALLETWRQRQGSQLTLSGYEAAGGVTAAIAQTAEREYAALDDTQRRVARQVLTRLTALGEGTEDTRRRVHRAELDLDGAPPVIERLAAARLLVVGADTVELAHEALIGAWPRLRGWLTEDRDALRAHRQLTDAAAIWEGLDRDPGALYRGARLALAREWGDRPGHRAALTGVERDFFAASQAAESAEHAAAERRGRQLRTLSGALAVLLVVAVAVGTTAFWQWREAVDQRQQALSRQLAAEALGAAQTDVAEGLRSAVAAYRAASTLEARGAVLALASNRAYSGRLRHGGLVKDVAFSPDGTVLAAAAQDGRVTLWDVARRVERAVLSGHRGAARAVAYHPGGTLLASAGLTGEVVLWDARRAAAAARLTGHRGPVDALAFSPDGATLASIGEDRRIRLWRMPDGAPAGELLGHGGRTADVGFSPDGRRLASAGDDGTAVVWDLARRARVHTLRAGEVELHAAVFSPDGRALATAGADGTVRLWDAVTGRQNRTLVGHSAAVRALAFSPDGQRLVSAGYDQVALVWDVHRGAPLARLSGNTSNLYGVAVSPDGRTIASASRDNSVLLWREGERWLTGQTGEVIDVALSPDGRALAASGNDGRAVLWDTASRRERVARTAPAPRAPGPAEGGGADQLVLTRDADTVTVWDAVTARPLHDLRGHSDRLLTAALHPGTGLVASGGADRTVRVWDARSGATVAVLRQSERVQRVLFSGDGRTLVAVTRDGVVTRWDTATRTAGRSVVTGARVSDAALHPEAGLLALGGPDGAIDLWDLGRGARSGTLTGHTGPVDALAFSPDGRMLASGSQDRTVVLWNVAARQRWATLVGHTSSVSSAAWSPAGDLLYTGGADQAVIPWTVRLPDALRAVCAALAGHVAERPPGDCADVGVAGRSRAP